MICIKKLLGKSFTPESNGGSWIAKIPSYTYHECTEHRPILEDKRFSEQQSTSSADIVACQQGENTNQSDKRHSLNWHIDQLVYHQNNRINTAKMRRSLMVSKFEQWLYSLRLQATTLNWCFDKKNIILNLKILNWFFLFNYNVKL